jgi:hypothetical protein
MRENFRDDPEVFGDAVAVAPLPLVLPSPPTEARAMLLAPALLPVAARSMDWAAVGYILAGTLEAVRPEGVDEPEWWCRLATLAELLDEGDDAGALRWLEVQFPALAGVPRRHRAALVRGLSEAAREIDVAAKHP